MVIEQHHSNDTVATKYKVELLESKFADLCNGICEELDALQEVEVEKLIRSLICLPMKLRSKYKNVILQNLPSVKRGRRFSELLLPVISFIDYELLEHMIHKFGSQNLNMQMQWYSREIQTFKEQTTVQQLINIWPGSLGEVNSDNLEVIARVKEDPQSWYLTDLEKLRDKYYGHMLLQDVISGVLMSTHPGIPYTSSISGEHTLILYSTCMLS